MEIWSDYYSLHMIYEGVGGNKNVKNIWRNIHKQNKVEKIDLIYDFVVQGIRDVEMDEKLKQLVLLINFKRFTCLQQKIQR